MGDTGIMAGFKVTLVVMLFYSFAITLISYALATTTALNYVTMFATPTSNYSINSVNTQVQGSLTRQTNIPVIELGALVFYSGNILIDLLLNFAYAIPQMLGLLIHSVELLFQLDTYMWAMVQIFASVLMTVLYFVGLIQLVTGVRSGQMI
jgi:hypothetical protein